jgi:hypothetical protein
MLRFVGFIVIVFVIVSAGSYFALPYFLPALFSPPIQADAARQLELLKLLSAAVAATVSSLITTGTSMLLVRHQLHANKDLEDHKGRIIEDLEKKKSALTRALEADKDGYALRRLGIEDAFSRIASLRDAISTYRHAVGALRRGEFDEEVASSAAKDLDIAVAFFRSNVALYQALDAFRQRGLYLVERAGRIDTPVGQRNLWREPSKAATDAGEPLGVRFAADAEQALVLLSAEREQTLQGRL